MRRRFGLSIASAASFRVCVLIGLLLGSPPSFAQRPLDQAGRQGQGKPTAASTVQPKFKAIWEPVNVKDDVQLMSVHFTSADEGWVTGGKNAVAGGVILHTKDGGATWEVQLGDSQSTDRPYVDLRFINRVGFAAQATGVGDHRLLRTTDGQNWVAVGTVPQHRTDYQFVSPEVGFSTAGAQILRTTNAGKQWQPVLSCRVKAEVAGLTRELPCALSKLFFVNAKVGYAISAEVERKAGFVVARTEDGGTTWKLSVVLPGETAKEGDVHFVDEKTGVLRTIDGKLFRSTDAGQTWSGVAGQPEGKPDFEFADAQVGWTVRYQTVTYTSDGGQRWLSRATAFPAIVTASSLPARDRGYVAGDHGMVYRYRVVPVDYTAKGMLPAPTIAAAR